LVPEAISELFRPLARPLAAAMGGPGGCRGASARHGRRPGSGPRLRGCRPPQCEDGSAAEDRLHASAILARQDRRSWVCACPCARGSGDHMTFRRLFRRPAARVAAMAMLAALGACAGDHDPPAGEPTFYRSLAATGAQLDAATAASMISGYRANNGLT